jgi:hypothetical protein
MRLTVASMAAVLIGVGTLTAAPAAAEPTECNDPFCVPGITGGVVLGAATAPTTCTEPRRGAGLSSAGRPGE